MAEPPTTGLPAGAEPERDVLVATRFHVPRAGLVPRPGLLARLAQGMGRGLTVVCTPAGFGKTTLLADWARRSRRPVAWLSLDAGDNDPARFWRYAATALERVRPGVCTPVTALLGGPHRPPLQAVVTTVINQLAVVPDADAVVLIMDDYHLIEASAVHDSVAFLLERLPPGLRLVVASRADPPLPLARLRARGSSPSCASGICVSRWMRRRCCCGRPPGWSCRRRRWPRCGSAPRGGRPGCSWPRCRCGGTPTRRVHRGVRRQQTICAGLFDRGGAGLPTRVPGGLPAGDLGAGAAVGAIV